MKAILYGVAILAIGGAAYFSFDHKGKFDTLEKDRVATIETNRGKAADADATESENKKESSAIGELRQKRDLLNQSVSSLTSTGTGLKSDSSKLDADLKAQDAEFDQLNKALLAAQDAIGDLGSEVTLETLPDKIQEIQDDKAAKEKKLAELEELVSGGEKSLASHRAEMDRQSKRTIERNSRIGRNAMQAVVTAVNQEWGFAVIGAGSNSGFTPQSNLLVQRDGRKIGLLRPSSIEPTQTIAEIDKDSLATGVQIQPGDRVILAKTISN